MTRMGDLLRRYDVPSTGVGEGWAIIDVQSLFFITSRGARQKKSEAHGR